VRGPDVEPGSYDRLTSNIDLTPTFVDWAGASAPEDFLDGDSFAPALRGEDVEGPSAILLRGCRTPDSPQPAGNGVEACGAYPEPMGLNWGLRTERYKFIDSNNFAHGESLQLFDLREDPWELTNLAYEPEHRDLVDQLSGQLAELKR
jgi:choline-sulfatase